jgi:predicted RNase H-like HicB family nuclease
MAILPPGPSLSGRNGIEMTGCRLAVMTLRYKVALHHSDEGIAVSVPGLPGCWAQGRDEDEALENVRDAIQAYLAVADDQLEGAEIREIEIAV